MKIYEQMFSPLDLRLACCEIVGEGYNCHYVNYTIMGRLTDNVEFQCDKNVNLPTQRQMKSIACLFIY
jgi:hypothetical protein